MKKAGLFLIIAIFMSSSIVLAREPDIRNVNWGMSREEVIKLEGQPILSDFDALYYETSINSLDTVLIYFFTDDKLTQAVYYITETHTNPDFYLDDYYELKQLLQKEYGRGTETITWSNDLFRNDPGTALLYGYVEYSAVWETNRTRIVQGLYRDNFEVTHILAYVSLEFQDKLK
ncbi:MAG: hypothetical protein GX058_04300 [Firmicutes bacterium]|nr:hypothetical protein [Bacillota bacterium]